MLKAEAAWKLRRYENLHDLAIEACTNAGFLRVDRLYTLSHLLTRVRCLC